MKLRELEKVLALALDESMDTFYAIDFVNDVIKEWEPELLDYINSMDYIEPLVEANGYKIYDSAMVLDVKGRPNIKFDVPRDKEQAFATALNDEIQIFANSLEEVDEDFVVLGRSGGYWGLNNLSDNIKMSEKGLDTISHKVFEIGQTEDYKDAWDNAIESEDRFELEDVAYNIIQNNLSELSELLKEEDCLEIKPEFLERMKKISDAIDKKEEEWQSKEFWKELL